MAGKHMLGREVKRLRVRPVGDYLKDAECHWVFTVLSGTACLVCYGVYALSAAAKVVHIDGPLPLPVVFGYLAIAAGIVFWLKVRLPRADYLAIHETGFRCRMRLRTCTRLFKDLESVQMGISAPPGTSKCVYVSAGPVWEEIGRKARENAMIVVPKRSKTFRVRGVGARFHPEDLRELMALVQSKGAAAPR